MDEDAYRQYDIESANWLRRGRLHLLKRILDGLDLSESPSQLLEVGAGVGQNLPLLAHYGEVAAAEIDPLGLSRLNSLEFLGQLYTDPIPFALHRQYDVICALDVIEHLADDAGAVAWIAEGLQENGHLIASVPAYQWLFSDHDRALGHYRRYTKTSFVDLLSPHFDVVRVGYFNSAVFPAVAIGRSLGRVRQRVAPSSVAPKKQNSTPPGPIDRLLARALAVEASVFAKRLTVPFGLSIFAVARRRA